MQYAIVLIFGYLIGCFSTADLVGRLHHTRIQKQGTGNLGASNVTVVLGWKMGILVGAVDIAKGAFATLTTLLCTKWNLNLGLLAGCACILGHMFPFYLKFHGGKGFATMIGVLFGFDWKFALLTVLFIVMITWITDYIVMATLTTAILFSMRAYIRTASLFPLLFVIPLVLVMFFKHRSNLYRIFIGKSGEVRLSMLLHK